ncbi:hypothetical protein HELRODRAFT_168786 [Helobdella robusta]|uniref:Uncharacterized protein n=1 Tax=Helobdella robusta TaxID=6412 RepID=T1F0Y9_HELRO|nr:hypothetical protein HELRODRAFT_168786 [Helobdella robusta]ESO08868.1 hypothetical protein HELRODRAFT_168786 [Helobdella robusta]
MARNRIASSSTELCSLNPRGDFKHYDETDVDEVSVTTFTQSFATAENSTENCKNPTKIDQSDRTDAEFCEGVQNNLVRPVESNKSLKSWATSPSTSQTRPRAKSYSSFGRLTSFMAGSPRPPFKYYHHQQQQQHASAKKKETSKSKFAFDINKKVRSTKTEALIEKYRRARSKTVVSQSKEDVEEEEDEDENDSDEEEKEEEDEEGSKTRPMSSASVEEAARLALAARAKYSKQRNSKCLEKAAFFIVMDDKVKSDHHPNNNISSPSQLENAENILLEAIQRQADEKIRLTPTTKSRLKLGKPRSRQPRPTFPHHHHHHSHQLHHRGSSKSRLSVESKTSDQHDAISPSDSVFSKSSATFDAHISSSAITPTDNCLFKIDTTAITAASTTINTPEDFLTPHEACSLEKLSEKKASLSSTTPAQIEVKLKKKSRKKSNKRSSTNSSGCSSNASLNERKKETISKLQHEKEKSSRLSQIDRLSSTVSSVFGQNGSSALLDPFTPQVNPITTTSANSKPVSPLSLVIAGLVMLSGTCAFLVSFALGRNGPWTLAASVVMGFGAIAVFSGLCWYLAHTSAPATDQSKIRLFTSAGHPCGVEIKVVDRRQLDDLIKKGACVETISAANVV